MIGTKILHTEKHVNCVAFWKKLHSWKIFTRPPVVTVVTNFKSGLQEQEQQQHVFPINLFVECMNKLC